MPSCASFVGCQGGAQQLFFSSECTVGNLCHELLHALGLYHEHTREDRDKYVTVNWQNIVAGTQAHLLFALVVMQLKTSCIQIVHTAQFLWLQFKSLVSKSETSWFV